MSPSSCSTAEIVGNDRAIAAPSAGSARGGRRRAPAHAAGGAEHRMRPHGGSDARPATRDRRRRDEAAAAAGTEAAAAPTALPGERHEPADGDRHADRRLRAAQPGRRPRDVLRDDQERRLGLARGSRSSSRSSRTSRPRLAHGHRPDHAAAGPDRRAPAVDVVLEPRGACGRRAWPRRSASSRGRVSTSRRQSRRVGCSSTSATSSRVLLFIVAVALSPTTIQTGKIPTDSIVEVVILIVVVVVDRDGVIFGVPKLRNMVLPPIKTAIERRCGHAARSPRRVVELLGGNTINALMYAAVMLSASTRSAARSTSGRCSRSTSSCRRSRRWCRSRWWHRRVVGRHVGALIAAGISTEVAVAAVLAEPARGQLHPRGPRLVRRPTTCSTTTTSRAPRRAPAQKPYQTLIDQRSGARTISPSKCAAACAIHSPSLPGAGGGRGG